MQDDEKSSAVPHADLVWLWRIVMGHRRLVIGALASGMVGGISAAIEPYLVGQIIDHVAEGISLSQLAGDVFLLILFGVLTLAAFNGQRYFSGEVAHGVIFDIRRILFDNLLTLEQAFYHRYATGDLISRLNSDLDMILRLMMLGWNRFGSALFTLIVAFVLMSSVNIPLTILVFIVLSISTAFQLRAGRILTPVFEQVQDQGGNLSALAQDVFSGIQTIKTAGKEGGAAEKYRQENLEYRRRWLYFKRRNEPVGMIPNMISETTAGIVVMFGGVMVLNGAITLGHFTQFLMYLGLISSVLLQLGTIYQRFQQTRGALARLTPLLQEAKITDPAEPQPLVKSEGAVTFDRVSVRLSEQDGGHWLLKDISLHIPAGSVVAFVGPTGCGKTLLVNLLARVLDPTEGVVMVDGQDVRAYPLAELRRVVSYVPQSTFLFSLPLHENVRMGTETLDEAGLMQAIHISRVSNDLPQLPLGLETLVGEKGVMLSGGQKQRVAIARAIVRDPAILVLDDALSSVDTQTAADILEDLRQVLRTRTSLIIAHRIATVKDADLIVVMDDGRIVEQGTHEELIQRRGMYTRMVERELTADGEAGKTANDDLLHMDEVSTYAKA